MCPGRGAGLVSLALAEQPYRCHSEPHDMWAPRAKQHGSHTVRSLGEQRGLSAEMSAVAAPPSSPPHIHRSAHVSTRMSLGSEARVPAFTPWFYQLSAMILCGFSVPPFTCL